MFARVVGTCSSSSLDYLSTFSAPAICPSIFLYFRSSQGNGVPVLVDLPHIKKSRPSSSRRPAFHLVSAAEMTRMKEGEMMKTQDDAIMKKQKSMKQEDEMMMKKEPMMKEGNPMKKGETPMQKQGEMTK
jgi:hypothetical protein